MNAPLSKSLFLLLLGALMLYLAHPVADLAKGDIQPLKSAQQFANKLDEKSRKAARAIEFFKNEIRRNGPRYTKYAQWQQLDQLEKEHGIMLFVYRNDQLILWSHNGLSPLSVKRTAAQGSEIHHFENGWYRLLYRTDGIEEYIAAIRIKHTYPYQNDYLSNAFADGFMAEGLASISTEPTPGAVKLKADHQYFYLTYDDKSQQKQHSPAIFLLFSFIGGMLIIAGLYVLCNRIISPHIGRLSFLIFCLLVILLRGLSINAGWPGYISSLEWFDPAVYASSVWFPSIADFSINIVVLLVLAFLGRYGESSRRRHGIPEKVIYILLIGALYAFSIYLNHLLKGLVVNSGIPFDINVVTSLNVYSFVGIVGAALAYFSYFLLADAILIRARESSTAPSSFLLWLLLLSLVHIGVSHFIGVRDMIFVLWPVFTLCTLLYMRLYAKKPRLQLGHSVLVVAVFAAVAGHNFIKYSSMRERNQRSILVERLTLNEDPIAELLYTDLRRDLARDKSVRKVFEENELHSRQLLEGYIIQRYFTGYWGNYDVEIFPFLADSSVWGKLSPIRPTSFEQFLRRTRRQGEVSPTDSTLFNIYNPRDLSSYIGIIPLHYNMLPSPDGHLIITISAKQFGQVSGFPALLVDAKTGSSINRASRYSTAKYVEGKLRNSSGDYDYRSVASDFSKYNTSLGFVTRNGYEHLVSMTDQDTMVVISKPMTSFLDRATVLSYLGAIFGLLFIIGRALRNTWTGKGSNELKLSQKIQILLVLLTLTSMILFAWATMFYIEANYTEKNNGLVREKMQSILREVQGQLDEEEEITYAMSDHVTRLLSQLSFVFYADIHMFSPEGNLLGSSQMRMFNEGLVSRQMNPEAYNALSFLKLNSFLHEERIGGLTYISAYTPLLNKQGAVLGYLNLPYFARQEELQREIGTFLETVINIFVLLFIISILIGLFISQWITAPLRVIRESLSSVELGKANRILGYSSQDEIGLLVAEYNAKVSELEHNAEKLARGERESAWREMAKQVAHEIKNPLTPMKLNIQHLQRSLERGDEVGSEQIKKLTNNLIEQINALTGIANAFSNFAKMPGADFKEVNLAEILLSTSTLYSNFDNIQLSLQLNGIENAIVKSDKDQLLRVFNNLIKNAIQAIPDKVKGHIHLDLSRSKNGYLVTVTDNGAGVEPTMLEKIFLPNFTTKTRGMGLGLAMSKSIVENSGGRIWYQAAQPQGSEFKVWLPSMH